MDRVICTHFEELRESLSEVTLAGILTPRLSDAILSFGERLSSVIVTAAFQRAGIDAVHLDARTVILTNNRHTAAVPLSAETHALLHGAVSRHQITVMGGFIGSTRDGIATTLGRGGSDFTAAIAGAAIAADEIQIWTDVDGMLTCDPRLVPEAHCLRTISYSEAEQMARFGAKVLHPATVLPAVRQRIPIVIRNSRNAAAPGTRVVDETLSHEGVVMSIACKSDVTLLHIRARNTSVTPDFGHAIWEAFQSAGVSFELISPVVSSFSLVIDAAALTPEFHAHLTTLADLTVEPGSALVTLIGRNTSRNMTNILRATQRLAPLPGGAILTSCTDSRFGFVVAAASLHAAAQELHREFFSTPNPPIFVPERNTAAVSEQASLKPAAPVIGQAFLASMS